MISLDRLNRFKGVDKRCDCHGPVELLDGLAAAAHPTQLRYGFA
jgi:hypothetical protein